MKLPDELRFSKARPSPPVTNHRMTLVHIVGAPLQMPMAGPPLAAPLCNARPRGERVWFESPSEVHLAGVTIPDQRVCLNCRARLAAIQHRARVRRMTPKTPSPIVGGLGIALDERRALRVWIRADGGAVIEGCTDFKLQTIRFSAAAMSALTGMWEQLRAQHNTEYALAADDPVQS